MDVSVCVLNISIFSRSHCFALGEGSQNVLFFDWPAHLVQVNQLLQTRFALAAWQDFFDGNIKQTQVLPTVSDERKECDVWSFLMNHYLNL